MAMEREDGRDITYEVKAKIAVLFEKQGGWTKELNLVRWNGQESPKYDIRDWSQDHKKMGRGVTLYESEMEKLIDGYLKYQNSEREKQKEREAYLRSVAKDSSKSGEGPDGGLEGSPVPPEVHAGMAEEGESSAEAALS